MTHSTVTGVSMLKVEFLGHSHGLQLSVQWLSLSVMTMHWAVLLISFTLGMEGSLEVFWSISILERRNAGMQRTQVTYPESKCGKTQD